MIKKLSAETNALTWFEIPAKNINRARKFYETILDIKMETMEHDAPGEETVFFPRQKDTIMALSGIVSGAIVKASRLKPGKNGALIYLNASPDLQKVLDRIVPAGGQITRPRTKIPAGYIAAIEDTEGNKVALHAAE
jgi:predicted enzyme related to lactoylglutathione lyase